MKTPRIIAAICAIIAALTLVGCASIDQLPEGSAAKARYTRTGKVSSTTIEADNFVKTGDYVRADRLSLKHSNLWQPNVEIILEGYERSRKPASPDKPAQDAKPLNQ